MDIVEIMEEFPLLSSWRDSKYWTGFICSETLLVRIAMNVPNFPSSQGISLQGDSDSVRILQLYQNDIDSLIQSKSKGSFIDFLRSLQSIIDKHRLKNEEMSNSVFAVGSSNSNFCMAIFNDLERIGTIHIENASNTFHEITLKSIDALQRKHLLKFSIPPQFPIATFKVSADLPFFSDIQWPNNIYDVYIKFKAEVEKYTHFWTSMDELDRQARVIDPVQPKRSDCHRRIMMNHNVVLHLVVNPHSPWAFPELHFSGPEKVVKELEGQLDKECQNWKENKPILENLENILNCEFMQKQDMDLSEDDGGLLENTCVICCSFEFEDKIPETTCDCGSIYHEKCLSDLLVSDLSVKAKRLCVDCPVCGMELKVSKAQTASW